MSDTPLPLGKLPPPLLESIIKHAPVNDPRVVLGPGIGLDCAVIDSGANWLVLKADPITFATDEIGWYAVQISANDIATTGAAPRWYLATVLLPENKTDEALVRGISRQLYEACQKLGISFIGGHTEITYGIDRPIIAGTMIGEAAKDKLITPQGAAPGDHVLLTKGIPIEATSLLAREFPEKLASQLTAEEIEQAAGFLHNPGISISRDAQLSAAAGQVTAMHDPTEGGLAAALWELSRASGHKITVNRNRIPIPTLAAKVCDAFGLDPMATIASGALLMSVERGSVAPIMDALTQAGIAVADIGLVEAGEPEVWIKINGKKQALHYPERDEITRAYEQNGEVIPNG